MTEEQFLQWKPMVKKLIHKYKNNRYIDIDDLEQVAGIGVINAYKSYNPASNMKFSTYVYLCISWSIQNELKKYKKEKYIKISMDAPAGAPRATATVDINLHDVLQDHNTNVEAEVYDELVIQDYIKEFRRVLTEDKASIFIERYIHDKSYKYISKKYNLTYNSIVSSLRSSRMKLIQKSYLIREAYNSIINQALDSTHDYSNPEKIFFYRDMLESRREKNYNNLP